MNQKNSLGLNSCFLDLDNPIDLFNKWLSEAEKTEINDPNAFSLATSIKGGKPNVRMILLKGASDKGFVFFTNLESIKSQELKENASASLCFHWKSLRRQIRIFGHVKLVEDLEADKYYKSRSYGSRIGAWASKQSSIMKNRSELEKRIDEFKKKYKDQENVPRPPYWSGWNIKPQQIEFWFEGENRIHERLNYSKNNNIWIKEILYP